MRNKNAKVSDPNGFITEPGSPERVIYDAQVGPDGVIEVVPAGKDNIQEKIESFRQSTDMSFILKQLALGNNEVLNQEPGMYGNFLDMPKTMAEAMQRQIDAEKVFYKLPVDVRGKFENDYRRWLVSAGSDEWIEKMGFATADEVIEKGEETASAE